MADIFLEIGDGIKAAAEDVVKWAVKEDSKIIKAAPGVLGALGVLAVGIEKAAADVSGDVANPLAVLLGGAAQLTDFTVLWPDVKAFFASIGITKL